MRTERQRAKDRADEWFSKYIRAYYANKDGHCTCFTCGKIFHWKRLDCGHFMTRDNEATRYEIRNVGPQCTHCNQYKGGRQYEFAKKLDRIWGSGTADEMEWRSKTICKRKAYDYRFLANEFREKFNELKAEKNLDT